MGAVPVHVILDPKAALHGAAWHALEVFGYCKIGQCTIDIRLGFGCRILAFDKFPNAVHAE
jgi:lactate dehydrogenase-like 2-hydroxyacid dehydrogenase